MMRETLLFVTAALLSHVSSHALSVKQQNSPTTTTTTTAATTTFTSRRIQLNGVEHRIRDTGNHPNSNINNKNCVAVLMHGLGGSADSWEDVAPILYREGQIRCVAVDRVGFGLTERPQRPSLPGPPKLPLADFVADVLEDTAKKANDDNESNNGDDDDGRSSRRRRNVNILPDPRNVLATALRRPETMTPPLPWGLLSWADDTKKDPYSSDFAVDAVWPLLNDIISSTPTDVYFCGHSAGGPLALRALRDAPYQQNKKNKWQPAGAILVSPAILDPAEDPDVYNDDSGSNNNDDDEEDDLLQKLPPATRLAIFRAVLSLPDAFGLPLARTIYDGRNITEALLGQISSRSTMSPERLEQLVLKYVDPVKQNPDDWDVGLLNVYRSQLEDNNNNDSDSSSSSSSSSIDNKNRGRGLLRSVPKHKPIQIISGDDDRVVPTKASRKLYRLLNDGTDNNNNNNGDNSNEGVGIVQYVEMNDTGHIPMDERPEEIARHILQFLGRARE